MVLADTERKQQKEFKGLDLAVCSYTTNCT